MVEPISQQAAVLGAVRSIDEPAELIDLLDQLLGTQSRGADTIGWIEQIEVAKIPFELLSRRIFGEEAYVMSFVVRGDFKARKYYYPMRPEQLSQGIDAGHISMIGQTNYGDA